MKSHMVTATGKRSAAKSKMRHMMIEPMANGFTAEHHMMPPESSDGQYMPPPDPQKHGFGTADELAMHVSKTFGGSMHKASKGPAKPTKAEVRSETPKEEAKEEKNEDEG